MLYTGYFIPVVLKVWCVGWLKIVVACKRGVHWVFCSTEVVYRQKTFGNHCFKVGTTIKSEYTSVIRIKFYNTIDMDIYFKFYRS